MDAWSVADSGVLANRGLEAGQAHHGAFDLARDLVPRRVEAGGGAFRAALAAADLGQAAAFTGLRGRDRPPWAPDHAAVLRAAGIDDGTMIVPGPQGLCWYLDPVSPGGLATTVVEPGSSVLLDRPFLENLWPQHAPPVAMYLEAFMWGGEGITDWILDIAGHFMGLWFLDLGSPWHGHQYRELIGTLGSRLADRDLPGPVVLGTAAEVEAWGGAPWELVLTRIGGGPGTNHPEVLVKLGPRGLAWLEEGTVRVQPPPRVLPRKPVGSGDRLGGAYAALRLQGASMGRAAREAQELVAAWQTHRDE